MAVIVVGEDACCALPVNIDISVVIIFFSVVFRYEYAASYRNTSIAVYEFFVFKRKDNNAYLTISLCIILFLGYCFY